MSLRKINALNNRDLNDKRLNISSVQMNRQLNNNVELSKNWNYVNYYSHKKSGQTAMKLIKLARKFPG